MSKIFAIGLPKTGTTSLYQALKLLNYRTLHNPLDFRILSYNKGIYKYPEEAWGGWDAITNFGEHFYPQLDINYPGSKFILTLRDKESWLKSSEKWFSIPPLYPPRDNKSRLETFGCITFQRERFSYIYDLHVKNAKNYFCNRSHDFLLLPLETEDKWEKLCPFLGKPIPNQPYPYGHKYSSTQSLIHKAKVITRSWIKYRGT